MPTYRYMCVLHGEFDWWQSIHDDTLECCPVDGEVVTKIITVPALYGVGDRGARTREVDRTEKQWDKDRPAYKRLRNQGLQPRSFKGCDKLEATAKSRFEIEHGKPYSDAQVESAKAKAQEIAAGRL